MARSLRMIRIRLEFLALFGSYGQSVRRSEQASFRVDCHMPPSGDDGAAFPVLSPSQPTMLQSGNMTARFNVVMFKGVEPETFWILLLNLDFQQGKLFLTTSNRLTERQLREKSKSMGSSDAEVESLIQKARANPM
jgi:hypothetical protein